MQQSEFYQKILDNTLHLSFSSLIRLEQSPRQFMQYYTGERETTPAMLFGQLLHCVILQPDFFADKFAFIPTDINRRTKIGRAAYQQFLQETAEAGKAVVSLTDYTKVLKMQEALQNNPRAVDLLKYTTAVEQRFEMQFEGFTIRGARDAVGFGYVADLKKCTNTDAKKLFWKVQQENLHVQGFLYTVQGNQDYYLICIADDLSTRVVEISTETLLQGERVLKGMLRKYKRVAFMYQQFVQTGKGNNPFLQSRNFWDADGVLVL